MLEINGIGKQFGGVQALRDVSLQCNRGEIRGLIGPNGAGKSSLINVISGVLTPDRGSVLLEGRDLAGKGPEAVARAGISRTFQNLRLFASLSVAQNVEVALTSARALRKAGVASFDLYTELAAFSLGDRAEDAASTLAYGDQRRLEILRALALGPSVLLLDEPAAGMNDVESSNLADLIESIRDRFGCTIIVIDHDLHFIMRLCERITVMEMGAVIAEGSVEEVRRNPKVIETYLGSMPITN
jgi:branched-chain amino acid transport system ATP-binding protein